MKIESPIWIFHSSKARFAGATFSDVGQAEAWIQKYKLSGVLTAYPVGESCFDWAVRIGIKNIEKKDGDSDFVGGFTSAAQEHYHFESGEKKT